MSRFIKYLTIIIVIFLIIITILNFQYIGILFIDEIYGKYPTLNKKYLYIFIRFNWGHLVCYYAEKRASITTRRTP